jgi:Rod binding domain-containing protein
MTPTHPSPIDTKLPPQQVARIQKASQDFEAMALGQMLAPMFETVDASKGPFGGGSGEQAWQPMMVNELGKQMAKSGGLGLARPIMEQMLRMQEAQPDGAAGLSAGQASREQTPAEQLLLERPALRRTTSQQFLQHPGA